jgi:spermidine dehydrogenase
MLRISRRDFLNGVALTVASGAPAQQLAAAPARYPPALAGLRGQHDGSFEVAHAFARGGVNLHTDDVPIDESYDLTVVGGGISGLAAAWYYRRAAGADVRILVLDNCDDFGGHAKRNEFNHDRRLIVGYGGSQCSIPSQRRQCGDLTFRMLVTPESEFRPLRANSGDGMPQRAVVSSRPSG